MSFDRHKGTCRHKKQKKQVQINRSYKQTGTRSRPKGWSRPRQKQNRFRNVQTKKETWNRPTVFKQFEAPNRDRNRTDSQTYVVAAQVSVIQSGSLSS